MRISINKVKIAPKSISDKFTVCCYGKNNEVLEWANYWGLNVWETENGYFNFSFIGIENLSEMFEIPQKFDYIDGFSPNLNKHLHIGHLSNLVIANALQHMGMGKTFIAIFGDTLSGDVDKESALHEYDQLCKQFDYKVDRKYFASQMKLNKVELFDGEGEYMGTKVFKIEDDLVVGVKSSGATTYFYQDVALAEILDGSTLYLTGLEQEEHFKKLKILFPSIKHSPAGLVTLGGKKMSSSKGNIIFLRDFLDSLVNIFKDERLAYNIAAGYILKSNISSFKSINMDLIDNPKQSLGLYISYTMAHIKSCDVKTFKKEQYTSSRLQFADLSAKINCAPNILFLELVEHCKLINNLYEKHKIKGNQEVQLMFSDLISDLRLGMETLGLFEIDKV